MRRVLGFVLICFAQPAMPAVTRCLDDSGHTHFSQFGCPAGTLPVPLKPEDGSALSVVASPPLDPEEKQALANLERALAKDRIARARAREKAARARARQVEEAAALCSEARRRLEALADVRRKGYSAASEPRLEAEETRWRAARKAAC
jgi:hypothetical protein